MLEVEKWSQNKHPFLAAIAQIIAFHSDDYCEMLEDIKEGKISVSKLPYPELKIWQKYYKNSRHIFDFISGLLFGNKEAFYAFKRELAKKNVILELSGKEKESFLKKKVAIPLEDQQKNIVIRKENAEKFYNSTSIFLAKEIDDGNAAFYSELKAKVTSTDEASFLIRVWIPCWYFYGQTPSQLLRKARCGDLKSLASLIRVDSSVIFDKRIASLLHNLRNKSPHNHSELMDCIPKCPKGHISRQKIKCFFAGIILLVSKGANLTLTEPEVRGLFDAVAKDKGQGDIDVDLPESPHALYVAMQREIARFSANA